MRYKAIIILTLLGLLSIELLAEIEKTDDSGTFSFYFENDYFLGTDRCFTGGWKLGWMSKNLKNYKENPFLRWMPFVNKPGFQHAFSIAIGQSIYTPDDISLDYLVLEDRPYAGILSLAFGIHSLSSRRVDTLEINLGMVGPHSYAEQMQKFIHRLTGSTRPEGWHNQLKDELALELFYERKWKLIQPQAGGRLGFDLIPHLGGGFGKCLYLCQHWNTDEIWVESTRRFRDQNYASWGRLQCELSTKRTIWSSSVCSSRRKSRLTEYFS